MPGGVFRGPSLSRVEKSHPNPTFLGSAWDTVMTVVVENLLFAQFIV